MFRRTFWFSTGVAAGVWATTKVNRKLRQLTPEHLAVTVTNKAIEAGGRLRDRAADFAVEVRDNMARREAELGDALGISAPVDRELPPPRRHTAIENRNTAPYVEGSAIRPAHQTYKTYPYNRNEDH
ncbi:hypothetical protein ABZ606_25170 [Streptomyces sp. NPDC012461]|jgi:hypothetical protein|uniref:hypothetical protein n=1 Tax=unclassified Streptomyces TaxID=2593676 RepID=UPI0013C0CD50|nr:hypothetical protein [Streptomyces sp. SID8111]MBM7092195.1 hypothetical protein [Streptomyces sp. S12]NEC29515.1 hypothetical protein [Streptomyces sp. SID8111]